MLHKKDLRIVGVQRDKLIVGLTMDDAVAAINLAMRVRKITFTLDFTDVVARLHVGMPGVISENIMVVNPRSKVCHRVHPVHPDLRAAIDDMHVRLSKLEAGMILTAFKEPGKKPESRLQLRVGGARTIALTLMDCIKGHRKTDTSFQLPDGSTP